MIIITILVVYEYQEFDVQRAEFRGIALCQVRTLRNLVSGTLKAR